jgi:hypothetical protein
VYVCVYMCACVCACIHEHSNIHGPTVKSVARSPLAWVDSLSAPVRVCVCVCVLVCACVCLCVCVGV